MPLCSYFTHNLMRDFDDFEKTVIRKIKHLKENGIIVNFSSLLDDYLENRGVKMDRANKLAWVQYDTTMCCTYDQQTKGWSPDQRFNAIDITITIDVIIRLIFLLNYLEKEGYVFTYNFARVNDNIISHNRIASNVEPVALEISDANIAELLINYFHKNIFASQTIVDLVNDNFKSKEEIRHEENIRIANDSIIESKRSVKLAKNAIWVAIATALVGIIISVYQIISPPDPNQQMLNDDKNTTRLEGQILKVINNTDQLNQSFSKHDTLNVRITKSKEKE